jgi:hypothetical protein
LIGVMKLASHKRPWPAITVAPPIARGTTAATGERKTSSSTRISTGSAIISARSVSDIVASWIARPITATPVR